MSCKCNEINDRCFQITGCKNVEVLLDELERLAIDYLLDHRDDEEETIPLITQIEERLELLEELEN